MSLLTDAREAIKTEKARQAQEKLGNMSTIDKLIADQEIKKIARDLNDAFKTQADARDKLNELLVQNNKLDTDKNGELLTISQSKFASMIEIKRRRSKKSNKETP